MIRLALTLLALVVPPAAAWLGARGPAWAAVVLAVWVVGLVVFFGLMAGPGFLLVLLAVVLALMSVWRRDRTRGRAGA